MNLKEEVKSEVYFYLADGKQIKSFLELIKSLDKMEDWIYNHHVSLYKNDFANWIRDVYLEADVADQISKVKSKKELVKLLPKILKIKTKEYEKLQKQKEEQARKIARDLERGAKLIETPRKRSEILKLLRV